MSRKRERAARPTILDVANAAGVSSATVSHVLNGTRAVSAETAESVQRAIAVTGYIRNSGARALRTSRTETIGVITTVTGQPVVDDMVLGIEERATELGFMVMLSFSRDDSMREWAAAQAYRDRRVEGLLLMPVSDSRFASAEQFAEFDIPLVILDRPSNLPVDQIYVANKEPMRDLTRHLITLGHTRLAFVSLGSNAVTLTQRREGFQAAVESASVPLDSTVIVTDSAEELRRLVTDTMSSSPAPTGFVTASQTTTGHLLEATAAMGLRVPEDIALVCFDDFPFANILSPRLTSAVQPAYTLGREAMSLLHTRMQDGDAEPRSLVLTPEIRHRDSCGCGEADVPI